MSIGKLLTKSSLRSAPRMFIQVPLLAVGIVLTSHAAKSVRTEIAGSPCHAQPRYECPDATNCDAAARTFLGAATEKKSGRKFFLD